MMYQWVAIKAIRGQQEPVTAFPLGAMVFNVVSISVRSNFTGHEHRE